MSMDETDDLLKERGEQYGDYETQAWLTQTLKNVFRDGGTWEKLRDEERESLDMIASKISRIINGRVLQEDSWADIAGYAQLVEHAISDKLALEKKMAEAGWDKVTSDMLRTATNTAHYVSTMYPWHTPESDVPDND